MKIRGKSKVQDITKILITPTRPLLFPRFLGRYDYLNITLTKTKLALPLWEVGQAISEQNLITRCGLTYSWEDRGECMKGKQAQTWHQFIQKFRLHPLCLAFEMQIPGFVWKTYFGAAFLYHLHDVTCPEMWLYRLGVYG